MKAADFNEVENLESASGYYLDKNLWNFANLFAAEGSIELAQRGEYVGRERVRGFLFAVFGHEGPVESRLGHHLQRQPVIHIAADGTTAQIRSRTLQQLSFDGRPSLGAAIWARAPDTTVAGQSSAYPPDAPPTMQFTTFPDVYDIPFNYAHPVLGKR